MLYAMLCQRTCAGWHTAVCGLLPCMARCYRPKLNQSFFMHGSQYACGKQHALRMAAALCAS